MPRRLFFSGKSKKGDDYDVVIHIGAPKTGSSAIQKFCLENRKKLLKEGFYYPKHAVDVNGISGGHAIVSAPLLQGNMEEAKKNFEKLLKEAKSRNAILLLSSEGVYRFSAQFSELTEGLSVKVIGFFRDPLESIFSNYNQSVKRHFSKEKLSGFCKRIIKSGNNNLSGANLLSWADVFGDNQCCFQVYTREGISSVPVEKAFLRAIGVHSPRIDSFSVDGVRVNKSYTQSALELKRLLNYVLTEEARELNSEIDWFLQRYSDHSEERYPGISELLDFQAVEALCDTFEPSNKALKERFGWRYSSFGDYERIKSTSPATVASRTIVAPGVPLQKLCEEKQEVANKLQELVVMKLEREQATFSLLKLADLFNIPVDESLNTPEILTKKRLQVFLKNEAKPADFLRELSLMMESLGNLSAAVRLIDRARELRPNGTGIKNIQSRLNEARKAWRS